MACAQQRADSLSFAVQHFFDCLMGLAVEFLWGSACTRVETPTDWAKRILTFSLQAGDIVLRVAPPTNQPSHSKPPQSTSQCGPAASWWSHLLSQSDGNVSHCKFGGNAACKRTHRRIRADTAALLSLEQPDERVPIGLRSCCDV